MEKEKLDKDDLIFTAYYLTVKLFKRHYHTFERYAKDAGFVEVAHKLESGEVLKETRLDVVSS